MRAIGFAIKKNELWFSVLDGTCKNDAAILCIERQFFNADLDPQELMVYFHNLFTEILEKYSPNSVAYKAHLDSNLAQIPYMLFPLGILNYVCKIKNIPTTLRSGTWISAGKKAKQIECVSYFLSHELKYEKLYATIVAWHQFL